LLRSKGHLGKLRVFKSGKVVLRIPLEGNDYLDFNLEEGIRPGFYQELATFNAERMCNLGQVSRKLVATPDLQSLFSYI